MLAFRNLLFLSFIGRSPASERTEGCRASRMAYIMEVL